MTASANEAIRPAAKWGSSATRADYFNGERHEFVHPEVGYRFASLTDGEGCFFIGKNYCSFLIKMRADDRPFLEQLRAELGEPGSIRQQVPSGVGQRKPYVVFEVRKRREVLWLTKVFDLFPLWSKKARDYAVWREAVIEWYSSGETAPLVSYARELRKAREYRTSADGASS